MHFLHAIKVLVWFLVFKEGGKKVLFFTAQTFPFHSYYYSPVHLKTLCSPEALKPSIFRECVPKCQRSPYSAQVVKEIGLETAGRSDQVVHNENAKRFFKLLKRYCWKKTFDPLQTVGPTFRTTFKYIKLFVLGWVANYYKFAVVLIRFSINNTSNREVKKPSKKVVFTSLPVVVVFFRHE